MNNDTCPTLFEHLPVEIVLKVFASFSLSEVVTTFSGLNYHIDSCIQAVKNVPHRVDNNNTRAIDLVRLFPTQVNRLIITNSPTVDFTALINLRSLTMTYDTQAQFDGIRPEHFPLLEILRLCDSK